MPSAAHQSLLLWAARRMCADGFVIAGFDGPAEQAGVWNALPLTFSLHGKRPDAWGVRNEDMLIAFGEAKTPSDVDTKHTRAQLEIFGFAKMRRCGRRCPLFLAVHRSSVSLLDRVLLDLDLLDADHIVRLHIPDILLRGRLHG